MRKNLFTGLVLGMVLAFSSAAFADPSALYGKWSRKQEQGAFTMLMLLEVQPEQSIFTSTCSFQGQTGTISATVPSVVTDTLYSTMGSASQVTSVSGIECRIDIRPMNLSYVISGDKLVMTFEDQSIAFDRAP